MASNVFNNASQGANQFPSIPHPRPDTNSMHATVVALKENVEVLTNQRGNPSSSAIKWSDLVTLGLIDPSQVPSK